MRKHVQLSQIALYSISEIKPFFYDHYVHLSTRVTEDTVVHLRTDKACLRYGFGGKYPHPLVEILSVNNGHLLRMNVPHYRDLGPDTLDYIAATFGIGVFDRVWTLEDDSEVL